MDVVLIILRPVEAADHLLDLGELCAIGGPHDERVAGRLRQDDRTHGPAASDGCLHTGGARAARGDRLHVDELLQRGRQIAGHRVGQRYDGDFGAGGHVERGDDARDALEVVGIVGDDQRIAGGADVDGVVGRDQGPQHGQQAAGRGIAQLEDLRDHLIATTGNARRRQPDAHRPALQLGVGLGHDLKHAVMLHHGKAGQAQLREQRLEDFLRRHRFFELNSDLALHPRIDDEVAPSCRGHRLHRAGDVGVDQVDGEIPIGATFGLIGLARHA